MDTWSPREARRPEGTDAWPGGTEAKAAIARREGEERGVAEERPAVVVVFEAIAEKDVRAEERAREKRVPRARTRDDARSRGRAGRRRWRRRRCARGRAPREGAASGSRRRSSRRRARVRREARSRAGEGRGRRARRRGRGRRRARRASAGGAAGITAPVARGSPAWSGPARGRFDAPGRPRAGDSSRRPPARGRPRRRGLAGAARAGCSTPYEAKTRASSDARTGSRTRSRHEK